jgi:hypothetical protein|tara:strand:- start:5810 stop:7468 length:1659 start_codon:yes stop_codon:yes gene_type:complete
MPAEEMAMNLLSRLSTLETQRMTWEHHWQEVADYIVPRKADITKKRSPGDKRQELIFDGTAIHSAELLSASLHGMLTNASTPWFSLRYRDTETDEMDAAKEWLESATDVMYQAFQRSNFQEQVHELYHDLITFGTGVMFVESDEDNQVRFGTRHISECYVSEDDQGRVDTVYRKFKMPARAAAMRFGEDVLSQRMTKALAEDPYSEVTIIHVVRPREDRDVTKEDTLNKPYLSCYIDPEEKTILSESGYDEFPYMVPRYLKASFELGYGRSPAMTALPDVKMLNKMSETTIRAAQKQVDPPLMVPDDGFMLPIRTVPGGLNFYRSGTRDRLEPLNIGANNPLGLSMEEQRRTAIRSAFFVDQLIMGEGPQMTATEVIQRTEEKMRLLGPVLGRLQAELLQPLINRVFNILVRQQAFPPAPDNLKELDLDIEYVSPLAKAQRSGDVQSVMRLFELIGPMGQLDPGVFDYMDTDGMVKYLIKVLGVPASVVRGEDEVYQVRTERAQQQAQQQQMAEMAQMAEAAGNAAPALNAVDDLQQQAAAQEQAAEMETTE